MYRSISQIVWSEVLPCKTLHCKYRGWSFLKLSDCSVYTKCVCVFHFLRATRYNIDCLLPPTRDRLYRLSCCCFILLAVCWLCVSTCKRIRLKTVGEFQTSNEMFCFRPSVRIAIIKLDIWGRAKREAAGYCEICYFTVALWRCLSVDTSVCSTLLHAAKTVARNEMTFDGSAFDAK